VTIITDWGLKEIFSIIRLYCALKTSVMTYAHHCDMKIK